MTCLYLAVMPIFGISHAVHALDEGAKAPNFVIKAQGVSDLKALKGKVVLVDFWAQWCKPCKQELPVLQKIFDTYKAQGLVIVAVSVDKDPSKAKDFLSKLGKTSTKLTFPVVYDTTHVIADQYEPKTMPSSFIIDQKGRVAHAHAGFRGGYREGDGKTLENHIRRLLGLKPL